MLTKRIGKEKTKRLIVWDHQISMECLNWNRTWGSRWNFTVSACKFNSKDKEDEQGQTLRAEMIFYPPPSIFHCFFLYLGRKTVPHCFRNPNNHDSQSFSMAKGLDSTPHAAAVKIKTTHQTIKIKIKVRRKYCRLLYLTFHVKNPKLSSSLSLSLIVSCII